ncbi:hypothetical protein N480_14385 [Pseudoalteromonas luteoviolacea S2607]|uniref:hypothetical protein n=1 Tax=Pseudoalteromonas luteoviolacea TaxID=43657 RepID=UPI0007B05831|nr:hypothetical protein [Pseudoalteromonas luteoviolacea]KZN37928.1 hypothetical protein N480_14385 [Pseudoalteromonas luteoviolacea S2607]
MKPSLFALTVALFSGHTFASNAINFDYVGVGYAKFKQDNFISHDGNTFEASKQFADSWVAAAQYMSTSGKGTMSDIDEILEAKVLTNLHIDGEIDYWSIGGAYLFAQDDNSAIELAARINRLNVDYNILETEQILSTGSYLIEADAPHRFNLNDHTNTYTLQTNYHYAFSESASVVAGIGYEYLKDAEQKHELFYQFGGKYSFAQNFTLSALYRNIDIYETYSVTLRYNF